MQSKRTKKQKKSVKVIKIKRIPDELKALIADPEVPAEPTVAPDVPATLEESALADNSALPPMPDTVTVETIPEPLWAIGQAIALGHVKEIVLVDPEPTLWQRLKKWFEGD